MLSKEEQLLLRYLSVFEFEGSFTFAEAEEICSTRTNPERMIETLSSLVDKSMLVAETTGRSQARYLLKAEHSLNQTKLAAKGRAPGSSPRLE